MTAAKPRASLGRNLTYNLLNTLGRDIVTGIYDAKPFPIEAEIEKRYGVSHSVTREAVRMLIAKGLLSARPRQGTIVQPSHSWNLFDPDVLDWLLERKFSYQLLLQFTELRMAVEPTAAALAASRATREGMQAIAHGISRMEKADIGEDDLLEADVSFHVAILQATDNPFIAQFQSVVSAGLKTSARFTNRLSERHKADLAGHQRVYDAIRKRQPRKAAATMNKLLVDARALFMREVKSGHE
jgi:DNA-binding FadR family transcriptional regulator